jgi:nicotinate-nucleotide adenylyltransferase
MSRTLIFGGAFNPVHIGHLRAAVEVEEALGFSKVEWVPSFAPRHKAVSALLEFDLRVKLLRAAVRGRAHWRVNEIEKSLPTPSFTYQTLEAMAGDEAGAERHFLLGDREFLRLPKWVRGREVPLRVQLVVVCRTAFNLDDFAAAVAQDWPQARRVEAPARAWAAFELVPKRQAVLLQIPRIEVSSSLVRQRWTDGCSLDQLTPAAAVELLQSHRTEIAAVWNAKAANVRDAS